MTTAPRIGFVLEQTLGHRTHAANLQAVIGACAGVEPVWLPVEPDEVGLGARLPVWRNWTIQAGVRTRRALAAAGRAEPLAALFVHTQVPAVLAPDWLRRVPTVVSLDATPLQYDELGSSYGHTPSGARLERLKWRANRLTMTRAAAVVAWSRWAADGVIDGYGVPADRVLVIPPGVRVHEWAPTAARDRAPGPVRILFVGGDFERKGGALLLDAVRQLRARTATGGADVVLDVVTKSPVEPEAGVTVHRSIDANSGELRDLYHRADVFCLPTLGDCLPMVLAEAGAAGLPLVATRVAAIPELVREGETGLVVEPGDRDGLVAALARLVDDADLRCRLGAAALDLVRREHDAEANGRRLLGVLRDVAAHPAASRRSTPAGGGSEPRVLITVSGTIDARVAEQVAAGDRPRADYLELADAFGDAALLDHDGARRVGGCTGRAIERLAGRDAMLAWACFRQARRYDAILTDGEQVGLPLALLFRLWGRHRPHHSMIVHIMSVPKKAVPFRVLGLARHIDLFLTYASRQSRALTEDLGVPADRVVLTPFMVDTRFFAPAVPEASEPPTICAVGLECRDYVTLLEAAEGLDARIVIAAGSPWSKRPDPTEGRVIPANVEVCRLGFTDLRALYARSRFLVMPLLDVPFQAGVTAILEAMAMGRAVVCTRTPGQTDVVVEGVTGTYVPPGDAAALHSAMRDLLAHPQRARRMGDAARRAAVERFDVATYAADLAHRVLGDLAAGRQQHAGGSLKRLPSAADAGEPGRTTPPPSALPGARPHTADPAEAV